MFKVGDRVRYISDGVYSGRIGTVTGVGAEFLLTDIAKGGFYPWRFELIESGGNQEPPSPLSIRCEYCDDHSHLTVECPGLRHGNPIAEAFKTERFPRPAPLVCSACGQPSHQGRKMFCPKDVLLCGDCVVGGTPLVAPKVEPLTAADCNSWQTACDEGVG